MKNRVKIRLNSLGNKNLNLFYILTVQSVPKIGFFMEILVTTSSTLQPSSGATLERLAKIWEETSLSSDHKMKTTSFVT